MQGFAVTWSLLKQYQTELRYFTSYVLALSQQHAENIVIDQFDEGFNRVQIVNAEIMDNGLLYTVCKGKINV